MESSDSELYKKLKEMYGGAPAEQKIQLLRHETMGTLNMASGYSMLILKALEENKENESLSELIDDTRKLLRYLDETKDVILAFSDE